MKYCSLISRVNRIFTWTAGILVIICVLIIVQDVVLRYLFHQSSEWAFDYSKFLLTYIFFLGLAPALESRAHVVVELFTERLSQPKQRQFAILTFALIVIYGVVFFWQLFLMFTRTYDRLFPTPIPVPVMYVYIVGPIGALQFILTAAAELYKTIRNHPVDKKTPVH